MLDGGASATGVPFEFTNDVVSYERRTAPVWVDLTSDGPAGERGEGDVVRNVESAYGGSGTDHLAGTNGPNELAGGLGHDTLIGRGGNDAFGMLVAGGFIRQWVRARGGTRGDAISCGSGRDAISGAADGQYVRPRCEQLGFRDFGVAAYPKSHGRWLTYTIGCPLDEETYPETCSGRLTLREASPGQRLLASGIMPRTYGELSVVVRLKLTPTGRQLATRRTGVMATVRMSGHNVRRHWWRIRLRLPQPGRA